MGFQVLRIPTLAVHLDRQETFSFNKETQLFPIAGLVAAELKRHDEKSSEDENTMDVDASSSDVGPLKAINQRHHPHVVELVAAEAGAKPEDVVDFELLLFDTQKSCLGGLTDEFIFSARLDNLDSTFCATEGLIESLKDSSALDGESSIRLMAAFDHEEIGSMTAQGAFGMMLPTIIRRLSLLPPSTDDDSDGSYDKINDPESSTVYEQSLASSFLISADMAHSVNPNYGAKYESDHRPEMNKGPVIKINANARYATNSPGIVLMQEVARKAGQGETGGDMVPLQLFVVRNDSSCGSTIGPMLSAHLGARTLDLGNPQLSMHSCRETGGSADVLHAIRLFSSFYRHYSELEKTILVD